MPNAYIGRLNKRAWDDDAMADGYHAPARSVVGVHVDSAEGLRHDVLACGHPVPGVATVDGPSRLFKRLCFTCLGNASGSTVAASYD